MYLPLILTLGLARSPSRTPSPSPSPSLSLHPHPHLGPCTGASGVPTAAFIGAHRPSHCTPPPAPIST